MLKKELRCAVGGGLDLVYEAGLAINCVSNIITEELARDLLPELTNLTNHPQPYLRKKAILCLFKLFVKYPQGLRLTFDRIQQCLEDSNSSVVSCAVNVITELSDKNPKNYLHLAPQFFRLLTNSSNNWMLIKVVKLLGSLVPEEPRLARKLLDPLAEIVRNTQAKSLLYESVRTITLCLPYCRKPDGSMPANAPEIVDLCARTLRDFVEQTDQNLKYLGLVGFGSLMQSHPRVLSAPNYRPLILACFSDQDVTIRNRALDLMPGMASRKNLIELVSQLLKHVELAVGVYKHNLAAKIIEICSSDKYELLQDFSWYLDVLLQLGHMRGIESLGFLLRAQVTDVALRVLPVRPYAVRRCMEVLLETEENGSNNVDGNNGRGKHMMSRVLPAIAWIIGEYSDLIRDAMTIDPDEGDVVFSYKNSSSGTYHALVECLLDPRKSENLSVHTQKVYILASMKILAAAAADKQVKPTELDAIVMAMRRSLPVFLQHTDVIVMERSAQAITLLQSLEIVNRGRKHNNGSESHPQNGDLLTLVKDTTSMNNNQDNLDGPTSATLSFLLKPSPMKPCGAKAQRKKRFAPSGVNIVLDNPADISLFSDLLGKEIHLQRGRKVMLESVSFTQQQLTKVDEPVRSVGVSNTSSVTSTTSIGFVKDSQSTLQKSNTAVFGAPVRHDPFYLAKTPQFDLEEDERRAPQNRFGTIQLPDSDNDNDNSAPSRHKKKKKEKKGKKMKSVSVSVPDEFVLYDSDNDDDENNQQHLISKRRPGKEFEGLARVDLTTPLREDEVMPERKHRVVPDRPAISVMAPSDVQNITTAAVVKEKREKKSKKAKKKSTNDGAVGDLLDLGADYNSTAGQLAYKPDQGISLGSSVSTNPINLAFDDLLSLSVTPTVPQQPPSFEMGGESKNTNLLNSDLLAEQSVMQKGGGTETFINNNNNSKNMRTGGLWLKGVLKSKGDSFWSQILVLFQLDYGNDSTTSSVRNAFLIFRIRNESSVTLNNVSLDIKGYGVVTIGTIPSLGSTESQQIGPFVIKNEGDYKAQEMKGSITINNNSNIHNCSFKLHLPVTSHLIPEENLSLDYVAEELQAQGWFSHSVRINLPLLAGPTIAQQHDSESVKQLLGNFSRAAYVIGSATKVTTGTYAARSSRNSKEERCRFLFKLKDDLSSIKIDIKTTNDALGEAIAADLKRIIIA